MGDSSEVSNDVFVSKSTPTYMFTVAARSFMRAPFYCRGRQFIVNEYVWVVKFQDLFLAYLEKYYSAKIILSRQGVRAINKFRFKYFL